MLIGELRTPLKVVRINNSAVDGLGTPTGEVVTVIENMWGQIRPLTGTERLAAGQIQGQPTWIIKMRYDSRITRKHIIQTRDGQKYNILSVVNVGMKNESIEMLVQESV